MTAAFSVGASPADRRVRPGGRSHLRIVPEPAACTSGFHDLDRVPAVEFPRQPREVCGECLWMLYWRDRWRREERAVR